MIPNADIDLLIIKITLKEFICTASLPMRFFLRFRIRATFLLYLYMINLMCH